MSIPVWVEHRVSELRYALRMMARTPGVTAVAVLSLALGIGANTAIFSIVDALLLKTLPVKSPHDLYVVASNPTRPRTSWNYPDYCAFRKHNRSFQGLAGYSGPQPVGLQLPEAGSGATTELAYAALVTGNYFEVLGVEAALGRVLNVEDDRQPGASPYVALSYDYWQSRFLRDPRVVGRTLRLNGYPFTIVGIARRGFRGADVASSPNLFLPVLMRSEVTGRPFPLWNNRNNWWLQAIGRLKKGATVVQAESELFGIYREQEQAELRSGRDARWVNRAQPITLLPAARGYSYVRNRLEKPLLVLLAVVGLVLLIACANVANLMLARGAARAREIAVRLALGAGRARLGGQLLAESLLIALLGGVAGLALSQFGVRALLEFMPQSGWSQVSLEVSPDLRLLAFTFAISLLTGVLFGMAPALQCTRPALAPALKEGGAGAAAGSRVRLRKTLVVVQVALSLLLLVGAGLFARSLGNLRDVDLGFRSDRTVVVSVDPSRNGYKGQRLRDFYERLRAGAEALPGVRSVSLAFITPLAGSRWNNNITVEGYSPKPGERTVVDMNAVGPRYFETLGIPILLGRDFTDRDQPPYSPDPPETFTPGVHPPEPPGPLVAIVTASFAQRCFAGRNPVGGRICQGEKLDAARTYEVVGVVKDAHYFGLREALEPMVYMPVWRAETGFGRTLCLRTSLEAPALVEAVRRQVTALDPGVPVLTTRTIEQQIDQNILVERLIATLASFFGSLALLLAGVGLYGVISYGVTRRTREIGIRMALGAQRAGVLWLIVRDAVVLVAAGAAVGLPAALALTRLVQTFLFGVSPQDPWSLAGGAAVLAAVAALASVLPARRAARVDPVVALRYE